MCVYYLFAGIKFSSIFPSSLYHPRSCHSKNVNMIEDVSIFIWQASFHGWKDGKSYLMLVIYVYICLCNMNNSLEKSSAANHIFSMRACFNPQETGDCYVTTAIISILHCPLAAVGRKYFIKVFQNFWSNSRHSSLVLPSVSSDISSKFKYLITLYFVARLKRL